MTYLVQLDEQNAWGRATEWQRDGIQKTVGDRMITMGGQSIGNMFFAPFENDRNDGEFYRILITDEGKYIVRMSDKRKREYILLGNHGGAGFLNDQERGDLLRHTSQGPAGAKEG